MSFKKGSILIGSVMLLLILALAFAGALNISSFRDNYTQSLVSSYAVAGNDTVRNIEYAVKYGKPLDNFFGMEKLLGEARDNSPNIKEVQVAMKDGRIVYNLQGKVEGQALPASLKEGLDFEQSGDRKNYRAVPFEGNYHVFLPLYDRDSRWIGTLDMVFEEEIIDARVAIPEAETLQYLLAIAILGGFALLLIYSKVDFMEANGEINKKRFLAIVLTVFSAAQLVYAGLNFNMFKDMYLDIARENTLLTAGIIQKDINSVLAKGVSYDDLNGIDEWMQKVIDTVPEVENVYISSEQGKIFYSTSDQVKPGSLEKADLQYQLPLMKDNSGQQATVGANINVSLSEHYIRSRTTEIALDALTVLVIAFFFMIELTIFLLMILKKEVHNFKKQQNPQLVDSNDEEGFNRIEFIRPLAFVFFLASSMAVSYIPLMMKELYQPLFGLSKDVVLGLPISMELLCVSLTIILTGYIIDRKGWRVPFLVGLVFLAAGSLLSGLAWNGIIFILARGVAGIGYGFCWMAMRSYCTAAASMEAKTAGLSAYNSGIFSGFNCGIAIGGMLAVRIGFSNVFFVALGAVALTAYFVYGFMEKGTVAPQTSAQPLKAGMDAFDFLRNPGVLGFFVLLTLPMAVCSMFMDYFFPLFGASINLSTANIGRGFLIHGLCIVYLGPYLAGFLGKAWDIKKGTIISALMTAGALVLFAYWGNLWAALTAILLLGLADSFGIVAQNNYYLSLPATGQMGENKALAYYSTVRRLGQVAGPFVFGSLAVLGAGMSVGIIGAACLALLLVFMLLAGQGRVGKDQEIGKTDSFS